MAALSNSVAVQRYLERHTVPGLPDCFGATGQWQHVLVVPAYRESSDLISSLQELPAAAGGVLVILVLNRPDSDPDECANALTRSAARSLSPTDHDCAIPLYRLAHQANLYLLDMEQLFGASPASMGVGLARKTGCDLALKLMVEGAISGRWIYSTDADAELPNDYFTLPENENASAAVFPFKHRAGEVAACNDATTLYERQMNHYVAGLDYAGSPYAFHTLGSCLAVQAEAYAQVRGFPKRAGGEDFYLLNKIAKTGPVRRLSGQPILLESRISARVPFGTGPAVAKIMQSGKPEEQPLFYHPHIFEALKSLLTCSRQLYEHPTRELQLLLEQTELAPPLAHKTAATLLEMGLENAIRHCRKQGTSQLQFERQFHQWFDGFRTLKFIHALSNDKWPRQSLRELAATSTDKEELSGRGTTATPNATGQ